MFSYGCRHSGNFMIDGIFPRLAARVLEEHYLEFRRTNRVQAMLWAPTEHTGPISPGRGALN